MITMTMQETILQEIRQGRNSVRSIRLSQPTMMKEDVRYVVRSLLYRGQIERVGFGKYGIPEEAKKQ